MPFPEVGDWGRGGQLRETVAFLDKQKPTLQGFLGMLILSNNPIVYLVRVQSELDPDCQFGGWDLIEKYKLYGLIYME